MQLDGPVVDDDSLICIFGYCLLSLRKIISYSEADEDLLRLFSSLLLRYDKDIRPSVRHDVPVGVDFMFYLLHIIDVVGPSSNERILNLTG
jgi:hypothetical protein